MSRTIDMTDGNCRWGHNVIFATSGNETETVTLVTTPAPEVGDTFIYYTEDAEIITVERMCNPRDGYEITVKAKRTAGDGGVGR